MQRQLVLLKNAEQPHGSHYVWEVMRNKVLLKVLPGLTTGPKGQGFFMIAMVLLTAIMAGGTGYYIETQVIHPPLQLFGVCPPPAHLSQVGGLAFGIGATSGCFKTEYHWQIVNNQNQTIPVEVPSGYFVYLNGSRYGH